MCLIKHVASFVKHNLVRQALFVLALHGCLQRQCDAIILSDLQKYSIGNMQKY